MMTSQCTSLYYANRPLYKQIIDDMGRAAARSDQRISRELQQASARLTYIVKRSNELRH